MSQVQTDRRSHAELLESRKLLSAVAPVADVVAERPFDVSAITYDWKTLRQQDGFDVVTLEQDGRPVDAVAGQYVAQLSFKTAADAQAALRPLGVSVEKAPHGDGLFRLTARVGTDFATLASRVTRIDPGAVVEPNFLFTTSALSNGSPDDPDFVNGNLWGLRNTGSVSGSIADADIDADEAWRINAGADVVVAVIDSSVDYTHPDLAANIFINPGEIAGNGIDDDGNGLVDDIRGWDFVDNDNDPQSEGSSHGTHVAGTIAAVGDNGLGVTGVAPHARILPIKTGNGGGSLDGYAIYNGILYVADLHDRGINVVATNNSYGGTGYSSVFLDAISQLNARGIMHVAAAGNDGTNNDETPHYPSNYDLPNVISVASSTRGETLSSFSNHGADTVDLAAPGSSIRSTIVGGGYANFSGTSMAAPHVAGTVALLASFAPDAGVPELRAALLNGVDALPQYAGLIATGGRLNANGALQQLNVVPAAPSVVALDAASDTGRSASDRVTKDRTPTFTGTAEAGVTVELFADGNRVGEAAAGSDGQFAVTPSSNVVNEGEDRTIRFTVRTVRNGQASDFANAVTVRIDAAAPTIVANASNVDVQTLPHRLKVTFSEIGIANAGGAVTTTNTTRGTSAAVASRTVAGDVLTLAYTGDRVFASGSALSDGNYTASIAAGAVTDVAGNASAAADVEFFVLTGDANRDRTVSLADFLTLRSNFGRAGVGHAGGDFNYDGVVSLADFLLLRSNFGTVLSPDEPGGSLFPA